LKVKKYRDFSKIKWLLKKKKITYEQLSKAIDLSIDAINNKLNGYTAMTINEAIKLVEVLNIEPKDFNKYFTGLDEGLA
jgi:transcriptional regulator with XRE-family HTH domain